MNTDSEEKIREAFQRIWRVATHQPRGDDHMPIMSIPVNEDRDADCIMHRAMNELFELRKAKAATPPADEKDI